MRKNRPLKLWEWKAYGHELLDTLVIRGHNRDKLYLWMRRHLPSMQSEHFAHMTTVEECRRAVVLLEQRVKKHNENHMPKKKEARAVTPNLYNLPAKAMPYAEMKKALEELKKAKLPWWRRLFA